jgi:hypothetical protein
MGDDLPLLRGVLNVYSWLNQSHFNTFPLEAKKLVAPLVNIGIEKDVERLRVPLLDSRNWYSAFVPEGELMQL